MKNIEKQFESVVKEYITGPEKIAAAVSGGADSMCLLHLLLNSKLVDKKDITVLSVNHNLRGENGERDVNFVADFCAKNGVSFMPFFADVPALAAKNRVSVELAAREARLSIYRSLKNDGLADKVLVAHHANDNAESVLMHILRGAGLNGLKGIETLTDGYILRPLLSVFRSEIDAYIKLKGIPFVNDETNKDSKYTRNFIRSEIMPLIKTRYPKAESALINLAVDASGTLDAYQILREAGVKDFNRITVEAVEKLKSAKSGAGVDLPNNFRAVNEDGKITVYRKASETLEIQKKPSAIEKPFKKGKTDFDGISLAVRQAKEPIFSGGGLFFDIKKIPPSAIYRYRKDGDIFKPYGSGGTKKLKEYLIDKKIPLKNRDKLVLVADGKEVFMILGVEISDKIKVEDKSNCYAVIMEGEKFDGR